MAIITTTVVDIGGTWTKIYGYKSDNGELILHREERVETPGEQHLLERLLNTLGAEYKSSEYIVGLPGPVRESSNEIFCPPLRYSVEVDNIRRALPKSDIVIMNDAILFLIAAGCIYEDTELSIYTIGTSLGHSCARKLQEGKILLLSLESAHIGVGDRLLNHIIATCKISTLGTSRKKMDCLNYNVLSKALATTKPEGSQSYMDLIHAIACEVAECEQLIPGSSTVIIEGGFGKWLGGREKQSNDISEALSKQIALGPRIVCGGVSFGKFRSLEYIRGTYCCPGMILA